MSWGNELGACGNAFRLGGVRGFFWKLYCTASIVIGILAIKTGSPSKFKIGILLGGEDIQILLPTA